MKVILASTSPRRKDILQSLGLDFEVVAPNCDEFTQQTQPGEVVKDLALQKVKNVAKQVAARHKTPQSAAADHDFIIAADTLVWSGDEVFGKPKDKADALRMLDCLQGSWHSVYTGVAIIWPDGYIVNYAEVAKVHMKKTSEDELKNYINNAQVLDKAGAYGIQDPKCDLVDKTQGEFETIMGLPTNRLKQELNL